MEQTSPAVLGPVESSVGRQGAVRATWVLELTCYCPECGEPDPDGMPDVEAFEVFGVTVCPDCAAALFENEETT